MSHGTSGSQVRLAEWIKMQSHRTCPISPGEKFHELEIQTVAFNRVILQHEV